MPEKMPVATPWISNELDPSGVWYVLLVDSTRPPKLKLRHHFAVRVLAGINPEWSDSEVRQRLRHVRIRTSESKDH